MPIKHRGDLDYNRIHTPSPPPLVSRRCVIKNLQTAEVHYLPSQEEFTLGRGEPLCIGDRKLSRRQLACYVDADNLYFSVRKIGRNQSRLDGKVLEYGVEYEVEEDSILELRLNLHMFQINFIPTEYINNATGYENLEEKSVPTNNLETQQSPKKGKKDQETNCNLGIFKKATKRRHPRVICPRCYCCSEDDFLNADIEEDATETDMNNQDEDCISPKDVLLGAPQHSKPKKFIINYGYGHFSVENPFIKFVHPVSDGDSN